MSKISTPQYTVDDIKKESPENQNIISWLPFNKADRILIVNPTSISISNYLHQVTKHINITTISTPPHARISTAKYDYIIIENINDCQQLPSMIQLLSDHLKLNGIIIFPFINTLGINSLISGVEQGSYTKADIIQATNNLNLHASFYNAFPNHFIPEIIFSNEYLNTNHDFSYTPLYLTSSVTTQDELSVYRNLLKNNDLEGHSNSYIAVIRKNSQNNIKDNLPQFIKFNNYRKLEYNLITYFKNNRYYKKSRSIESHQFLKEIQLNHSEIKALGFNILAIKSENDEIYSIYQPGINLCSQIRAEFQKNSTKAIKTIRRFWNEIKSKYQTLSEPPIDNIFQKLHIDINHDVMKKMTFVSKLYIDMIPQNVIIKNNKYYFYDQEWSLNNAPLEFLLFRIMEYTAASMPSNNYDEVFSKLISEFNLTDYVKKFKLLDKKFIDSVCNDWHKLYKPYQESQTLTDTLSSLNEKIKQQEKIIKELEYSVKIKDQDIQNIFNSTSWKITKPMR